MTGEFSSSTSLPVLRMTSISGNTGKEGSPLLYKEVLWTIKEINQLVDERKTFSCSSFDFCGQSWVLDLQVVKILVTEETLFTLRRLKPDKRVVPQILHWDLGIDRGKGRCSFGSGRVGYPKTPWSSWYIAAVGFGPRFSDLVDEDEGFFIPRVGVTIRFRLSCDTAEKEPPVTMDVSVQTEDEDRRDIRQKRYPKLTKEDERMVQQFRQMLRSEEDKERILRERREESKANYRKILEQLPKDNDEYDFFAS